MLFQHISESDRFIKSDKNTPYNYQLLGRTRDPLSNQLQEKKITGQLAAVMSLQLYDLSPEAVVGKRLTACAAQ